MEACVGVISACLPTLRPLLSHYSIESRASSLRKVFYWRSNDSTIVKVPSHADGNSSSEVQLDPLKPERPAYGSYTVVEGVPRNSLSGPRQGIYVQREFYHKNEPI